MSTALYVATIGQQGGAGGAGKGAVAGGLSGGYGYAETLNAYAMKWVVEQTRLVVNVDPEAVAGPVVAVEAEVNLPMLFNPEATATPRVTTSVPDAPLVVQWASAGSPKVKADATIPLQIGATATVVQRIVAAVTLPIRMLTASSVMLTIRAAVIAAIKWVIGSRGRVGYRRVRGRDLSGVAILEQEQSGQAMPVRNQSQVGVRVKDDSEGRPW